MRSRLRAALLVGITMVANADPLPRADDKSAASDAGMPSGAKSRRIFYAQPESLGFYTPSTHSGRSCARVGFASCADLQHPEEAEAKMRAATAVGPTAILIVVAEVWACAAGARDAIKPGKWEFWIVGSKIPEPPPGTRD